METDLKAISQILSKLRGRQDEAQQLADLAERLGPNWQKGRQSGAIPQGERSIIQMLRGRLQELQEDARQRLESALKGVDSSSAAPSKPDLHPAKVQAARAQAAYLATARTSQLKPIAYLAVAQPVALPYLATTRVQLHPGKIQAARVQAAYLATARTARPAYLGGIVPYLATTTTSLHPMKVQAARSQAAYLATARTARPASIGGAAIGAAAYLATSSTQLHPGKVRAARVQAAYLGATRTAMASLTPSAYLAQPSTQTSKINLHPGKIQAARAQAAYLATARTARPAAIGIAPYLATAATTLHPMKVQAARAQAAYLTTTRTAALPAPSVEIAGTKIGAYLAAPYLVTSAVQAARAQAAYLATVRSVKAAGQPSPSEISGGGGGEKTTPQRVEIPGEVQTKINDLVKLQKAIKAIGDI